MRIRKFAKWMMSDPSEDRINEIRSNMSHAIRDCVRDVKWSWEKQPNRKKGVTMDKFDLKTKCHCLNCGFEGTYDELEYTDFNRGEPSCPYCGCEEIEEGPFTLLPDTVEVSRETLEELRDWLSRPQTTGGSFPMETHRAESEGLDHIYSEIIDALEGGE